MDTPYNEDLSQASWSDKQKYSNVWTLLLIRAATASSEGRNLDFYRTVDSLVTSLFKGDRESVREYAKNLDKTNRFRYYTKVMEKIIDNLADSGYLRWTSKIRTGGED